MKRRIIFALVFLGISLLRCADGCTPSQGTVILPAGVLGPVASIVCLDVTGLVLDKTTTPATVRVAVAAPVAPPATIKMLYSETPAGVMDGANRLFKLSQFPNAVGPILVFRNKIQLNPCPPSAPIDCPGDYQTGGNVILFMPTTAPNPGDTLEVVYWHAVE